jgi:hypothetical protein
MAVAQLLKIFTAQTKGSCRKDTNCSGSVNVTPERSRPSKHSTGHYPGDGEGRTVIRFIPNVYFSFKEDVQAVRYLTLFENDRIFGVMRFFQERHNQLELLWLQSGKDG